MSDELLKQTAGKPLFPDMLWSRPENKRTAGKLLIIGGHSHAIAAPSAAYQAAMQAGAGVVKTILPESVKKIVGTQMEGIEYAPVTPSGSFSRTALAECLEQANWADGVLLAGDFGHNSETAVLLDSFLKKYSGQLTLQGDAVEYFYDSPQELLSRPTTTLATDISQLQKLTMHLKSTEPIIFQHGSDLLQKMHALSALTEKYPANTVLWEENHILVGVNGLASVTDTKISKILSASSSAVWWLQNPAKTFEALTSAQLQA